MILAHKIALDPTREQAIYFARACGVARFSWNWALVEWKQEYALWREYRCGPKPNEMELRKRLNAIKREQFPWMMDVSKFAPEQAIRNLGVAFERFFKGLAKYPRFKKKGKSTDSYMAASPGAYSLNGRRIKLPNIGWVRMREELRFSGKPRTVTVSRVADRWFASIQVELAPSVPDRKKHMAVGVDLGIKSLATLSDGTTVPGPKALHSNLRRLKRLSRALSRKVKGSANRNKARRKVARLHARVAYIRKDALHKLTTDITKRFSVVGIEDLNVRGMMKNHHLARSIADVGIYEFRRQLQYKAAMRGCQIVVADRWYPSSKTCSECGYVHADLRLSDREWVCSGCGEVHDRDRNAAVNLMKLAASSAVTVCGAVSSGSRPTPRVKLTAVKQKLSPALLRELLPARSSAGAGVTHP